MLSEFPKQQITLGFDFFKMRKKKAEHIILPEIEIIDAGAEGKAVGRRDNKVIFVDNAVPGDVADIQVFKKKKSFLEGKAIHFHKLSEKRSDPFCKHFGLCGGCKWQHLQYKYQLFYKQKQVADNFQRIAHLATPEILPIIPSEKQTLYRNKLEYTFSDYRWLTFEDMNSQARDTMDMNAIGFHIPKHFDRVLDIEHCYLQSEPTNHIRNSLKSFCIGRGFTFYNPRRHEGFLRNLIIRNTTLNETMAIMVFGEEQPENQKLVLDHILEIYPRITSLMFVVNSKHNDTISDLEVKCYFGKPFITEQMDELLFRIGPVSFFQTNSLQAYKLYSLVKEFAGISSADIVYDLYSGTGSISNFVAHQAKKVIGIEFIAPAIEDALVNSKINNIHNTEFVAGDIAKILNVDFFVFKGHPDIIITDPPRNGMHPAVVEQIIQAHPKRIVYVSCNPATQARDLALMAEKYSISKIQPIDMFPHTHHVENIVLLEKAIVV
jgi:23S rRNA (uracil1939-C5)-methyltransferase